MSKRFAGVHALRDVDLDIRAGEILAVVGANGAGKSTLMKILAGVLSHDSGKMEAAGISVRFASVRDAMRHGIALVHQELNLADNLDIAGNILFGREVHRWGFLRRREMHLQAREWMDRVGLDLSPSCSVASLSMGRRQMVEIAKALSMRAQVLILDEPTSSLSMGETSCLLRLIRTLADQGVAVVVVTHRLDEVLRSADRAVVLRDGACIGELKGASLTRENLVKAMVGAVVESPREPSRERAHTGDTRVRVQGLRTQAYPREMIHLSIGRGEIVGIAGLVGAGRTEVLRAIFGIDHRVAGSVVLDGHDVPAHDPVAATRLRIAMVCEDRQRDGLMIEDSAGINASLVQIARESVAGFIRTKAEKAGVHRILGLMRISPSDPRRAAGLFSGGNQQKIVLARWLMTKPNLMLLDEPSRGVDVIARGEIHALIRQVADQGASILCALNDTEELLLLCDRIVVMRNGKIVGEMSATQASEEAITRLAVVGSEERAA